MTFRERPVMVANKIHGDVMIKCKIYNNDLKKFKVRQVCNMWWFRRDVMVNLSLFFVLGMFASPFL